MVTGDYERILKSETVFGIFEEENSMHERTIEERCANLMSFILADYCHTHDLSPSLHEEVFSVTKFDEAKLIEKVRILQILNKSVERVEPADELNQLFVQVGIQLDSKMLLFLRMLSTATYERRVLAVDLFFYFISSGVEDHFRLSNGEREKMRTLLSRGWNPLSLLWLLLCFVHGEDFSYVLELLFVHHVSHDKFQWIRNNRKNDSTDTMSTWSKSMPAEYILQEVNNAAYNESQKTIPQLLEEIKTNGQYTNFDRISKIMNNIKKNLQNPHRRGSESTQNIPNTIKRQNVNSDEDIAEIVTLISLHAKKTMKHFPRNNQLLTLVTLLTSQAAGTGSLLEVATGEGKSLIIAMFAAVQALRGNKVDIVTSSDVLAERDAKDTNLCRFYKQLGLSSCSIPVTEAWKCKTQDEADALVRKKYEKCDIIYGTTSDFAADILRDEFECRNIRGRRKFQVVIVDEVDSITIDNGLQVTYLSHDTTCLRHIDQLLATIWCTVCTYIPVEEAKTGEILWVTTPQYIHTKLAENFAEDNDAIFKESIGILKQLFAGNESELQKIDDLNTGKEINLDTDKRTKEKVDEDMDKIKETFKQMLQLIKPEEALNLLCKQPMAKRMNAFEAVTYYSMRDDGTVEKMSLPVSNPNVAEPSDVQESSTETVRSGKISLLLLDKGRACEVYRSEDLIDLTKTAIMSKVRYSDKERPASSETDKKNDQDVVIPVYVKDYVEKCFPTFVQNALNAIRMTQGREYIIVDKRDSVTEGNRDHSFDRVVPVDFMGTGVLEKNKKWGNGLQQFLEFKHQLAISPLSTVTNFLSNYSYFRRYSSVFGVSGTLGDNVEHDFVQKHFRVECFAIPTHRTKKLTQHSMIQVEDREAWKTTILDRVKEITKSQPVLVVCEDLKTADELQNELNQQITVKMYVRSDVHGNVVDKEVKAGDVIITTTLGGRGTDYKVNHEVNKFGGLFVLMTFFPHNIRVEKQMIGRTARKGNTGMSQFILNKDDLADAYRGCNIETMYTLRAQHERERIKIMEASDLEIVKRQEHLFVTFCKKLQTFSDTCYTEEEKKQTKPTYRTKFDYDPALNAVKERWAFWLILHQSEIDNLQCNGNSLERLEQGMLVDISQKMYELQNGNSNNFYDHARNAMNGMTRQIKSKKTLAKSDLMNVFVKWQKLRDVEKVYNAVALYNQAYLTIKMKRYWFIEEARKLLDEAEEAIKAYTQEMANITSSTQIASKSCIYPSHLGGDKGETNFSRQQMARGSFIKAWLELTSEAKEELNIPVSERNDFVFKVKPVGLNSRVNIFDDVMEEEMLLLHDMGMTFFFQVEKEKKSKFCWDALWCCVIGGLQAMAGVLVIAFSAGALTSIGTNLINEGISDMISGVQGMISGTFSWAQWAISKAISLAISLVGFGISALKKAWKAVSSVKKATQGTMAVVQQGTAQGGRAGDKTGCKS